MDYSSIELSVTGHVAHLVLNRPDRANVINAETSRELLAAAIECDENPDIRAVLIRANGPMFCGGGDLKTFVKRGDDLPAYLKETTTYLHGAVSRLTRQSAPVVCAVHGFAAGGGFSLAISGDLVLASQSAKFTMAYTKAGLTPRWVLHVLPAAPSRPAAGTGPGTHEPCAVGRRGCGVGLGVAGRFRR